MAWPGHTKRRATTRDYTKLDARIFRCLDGGPARLPQLRDRVGTVPYHSRLRNRLQTLIDCGRIVRTGDGYGLP